MHGTDYLRGLTVGRLGLVLLLCLMLTLRQQSLCIFQITCGMPSGGTAAGFASFLGRQFLFSLPLLLLVTVADNATLRERPIARILALSLAVVVGSALYGTAFLYTQPPNVLKAASGREWLFILTYASRALLYGGLATALLYLFKRERELAHARQAARLEKASLDRQTIEARLQVLQAQIEPHFLFNTLANIKMLHAANADSAKPLVRDLGEYLRTALPMMRDMRSTIGRELDLALAFLRVLQVRMDDRLRVVVDVPADLRSATLPPMMLLTLVENAVKHGLAPSTVGGIITIRAERRADRVRVMVLDDGVGFAKLFGGGVGLANTRARLAALYGAAGQLAIEANEGGGVAAVLELPCEFHAIAVPTA
jgi:sensor histidine kinase YesM